MKTIVDQHIRIDLHIHSRFSSHKESADSMVSKNSISNLPSLLSKLEANEINLASITDHNRFSYEMYLKFKELTRDSKIVKKVLPGVEFDLNHKGDHIHVVAIFDDRDEEKIRNIEKHLTNFDENKIYGEDEFRSILLKIGTSVLLIPHQKDRIEKTKKRDLSNVGIQEFVDSISFFDAIEFKSYNIEPYIKNFKTENSIDFSAITGSDCHEWNVYPKIDSKSNESIMCTTYIRALPTFKGLVMALTESSRISLTTPLERYPLLSNLDFGWMDYPIRLSPRLNVIIGDNSIGKSAILHLLTDNKYVTETQGGKKQLADIYKEFNTDILQLKTVCSPNLMSTLQFQPQGSIRKLFEHGQALIENDLVKGYFEPFNYDGYQETVLKNAYHFIDYVKNKDDLRKERASIDNVEITLPKIVSTNYFPKLSKNTTKIMTQITKMKSKYHNILKQINTTEEALNQLLIYIDDDESKIVKTFYKRLQDMKDKYTNLKMNSDIRHECYNLAKDAIDKLMDKKKDQQTENDKLYGSVLEKMDDLVHKIIKYRNTLDEKIQLNIQPLEFSYEPKPYGNFKFIDKPSKVKFYTEDIYKILDYAFLEKRKAKDYLDSPFENIKEAIGYNIKYKKSVRDFFVDKIKEKLKENEFQRDAQIIYKDKNKSKNRSAGTNALMYLDLLSQNKTKNIIFLDQPEDDVAQAKINDELISILREVALDKQVIMITHNPQLVVNLDVDNVICLKHDGKDLSVSHGALEYEGEFNILNDVADTLDGGTNSIMKRWKIYDKTR